MKKIGVVSIFRTGNYGGTLQAYALVKAIQDNGLGQAEIINYCCDAIRGKIDGKYLRKAGVARTAAALVDKMCYLPRMKKMNAFIDSFVPTKPLTRAELPSLNDRYDLFLSGSDQLWNPDIQQGDYYYLQDFVTDNRKKRSYASSFGRPELPEQYREVYRKLLSQYQCITVREQAGADLVEDLLQVSPAVVLDPTLLLTAPQWEALLPPRRKKGKYLFVYRLTYSTLLTRIVARLQKETGLPILAVPFLLGYTPRTQPSPALDSLEWVRAIHDADYVITDSFHGIVFSILFGRPFYYVVTTPTARQRISRVETLLESLGLQDRIVESQEACDFSRPIAYEEVWRRLDALREESLAALKKVLG